VASGEETGRRRPSWSLSTKRFKLVVAYDGTDFRGWAAQPGQRTVQGTLKEAVRRISGEDCEIVGASRTDSGAHAEGQVCHLDSGVPIKPENWVRALNRVLPPDLRVRQCSSVSPSFHARFCALDRTYLYVLYNKEPDPRAERFSYSVERKLNLRKMQEAARKLEGTYDFKAFTEELEPDVENTTRTLFRSRISQTPNGIRLTVRGTAFLRGMMRRMAGAILEVGVGKRKPEDIEQLLDPKTRGGLQWPKVLPAKGLTLVKVRYGPHPRDIRKDSFDIDLGEDGN
jgi:tRNA pseudouridine38-40 synthase